MIINITTVKTPGFYAHREKGQLSLVLGRLHLCILTKYGVAVQEDRMSVMKAEYQQRRSEQHAY